MNSLTTFTSDSSLGAITVDALKDNGELLGLPTVLVSAGVNTDITTSLQSGKLKSLVDLRDQELPNILSQLDMIASTMRDELNAIHNTGSGLPASSRLEGTRPVGYKDISEWTGTTMIAALNADGTPVTTRYGDTDSGFLPLTIDFDQLRSEYGNLLTTEVIMREINSHFLPQNKAVVGNLNNIKLAALNNSIPDGVNFDFDLELENISDSNANMWVTNVTVLDDAAAVMGGAVTSTIPTAFNFNPANTFDTLVGSGTVTVNSTGHGLSEGDVIYMSGVSAAGIDGIPAADVNGQAFRIVNVSANSFDIEVTTGNVAAGNTVTDPGAQGIQSYASQNPGTTSRTSDNGAFSVDLSGNLASSFYTIQVDVMVEDDNGNISTTTVDYRVANNQSETINKRYTARAVAAGGTLEIPINSQPLVRAVLLDDNGNIAAANENGYLTLIAGNEPGTTTPYTIAINDLGSQELGRPNDNPVSAGSGRGFSHYYGLNDFFVSNEHSNIGDTVAGSAYAMRVRDDIQQNANLVSMGTLTQSVAPADPSLPPYYTFERTTGDNTIAKRLANLGIEQLSFVAAGGLPTSVKTFNGYASEVLGYNAGRAAFAESRFNDEQALLEGFKNRDDAVRGVNIDEEMANTIIFQNAYSASSQVIRVVKELFDTLMATF